MTERIKTIIRVRPFIGQDEQQGPLESCVNIFGSTKMRLFKGKFDVREFMFDEILEDSATEQDLFSTLFTDVINDIKNGINRCILTYGQTSSGKTYTLFGESDSSLVTGDGEYQPAISDGLVPRVLQNVYQSLSNEQYEIQVQYIQIYNNSVFDLLAPAPEPLKLRELEPGQFDCEAQRITANSMNSLFELLTYGAQRRVTAATRMNINSSRSHVILKLFIAVGGVISALTFCDLAGSERVSKTQSQGDRLSEAKAINESLSALGNVVVALAQRRKHVPFRDSVLTKLLQESLSGNSRALLICCICQQGVHFDESVSSLEFAERCGAIQTRAVQNRLLETAPTQVAEEQTVFGRFGLHQAEGQEIGFVRCTCPTCGCKLTVLDDEFAEDYAELTGNVDEEVKIGLRCMQDEVERLRQEVIRYEAVITDTRAALALLERNPELAEDATELADHSAQEPSDAPEVSIGVRAPDIANIQPNAFAENQESKFSENVRTAESTEQVVTDSVYEIGESQYEHRFEQPNKQLEEVGAILQTIGKQPSQVIYQRTEQAERTDLLDKYLGSAGPKLIHTKGSAYPRIVIGEPK